MEEFLLRYGTPNDPMEKVDEARRGEGPCAQGG